MYSSKSSLSGLFVFSALLLCLCPQPILAADGPFNPPAVGTPSGYRGFVGSYNFPMGTPPPAKYPWTEFLDGRPISAETAGKYVAIVKEYISRDMIALLSDMRKEGEEPQWNAASRGWYNEPWLATIRGGIHGVYTGSTCFSPVLFPKSGLKEPFTTYVLVFYDKIGGYSLGNVWSASQGMSPNFGDNAAQFPEGSIIVKAAFATATEETWEPMAGALSWNIYTEPTDCPSGTQEKDPTIFSVQFFQFDIIVKDSVAAPQTKWVFSTLVYDKDAGPPTTDVKIIWHEKMVPLGAMWGNDPDVTQPGQPLKENWINPKAPVYSKETLGWGGRLSGPNDGSVQNPPYTICSGNGCNPNALCENDTCQIVNAGGPNLAMSSCMSCHSTAQYAMASFLLPTPLSQITSTGGPVPATKTGLVFYEPASENWMTWFQNRPGEVPKDAGTPEVVVATDYDMNVPFKSLQPWAQEVCINQQSSDPVCQALKEKTPGDFVETDYQGLPVRSK